MGACLVPVSYWKRGMTKELEIELGGSDDSIPATFPFASVRPGQREFLFDAVRSVRCGRHLLAQAPTGLGKTAVGLGASLDVAIKEKKLVLFLTSRQSQHRIVVDTLRRIRSKPVDVVGVDIVSKTSMCPQANRPRGSSAFNEYCELMTRTKACRFVNRQADAVVNRIVAEPIHVQDLQELCSRQGVCPHKAALEAAAKAQVIVCDYNYVFSSMRETVLTRLSRRMSDLILVIDEAHNLPERIRSQLCGKLSPHHLLRGAREAKGFDRQLASFLYRFSGVLTDYLSRLRTERRVAARAIMDIIDQVSGGGPWSVDIVAESCRSAGEFLAKRGKSTVLLDIASFINEWKGAGKMVVRLADGGPDGHLAYRLLDPSFLSREIFTKVHSSIIMSGTLHPGDMYADMLGLEKDRVVQKTYASPFPPENRLTVVTPHLTTTYHMRTEEMMSAIASEISRTAKECPGNLAAFFPSYSVLSRIAGLLRKTPLAKHLIVERPEWDKSKRDMAVLKMRELKARGGALLFGVLGGSFSEGIDYNDNLLSCVIVAGLPISPPTAEVRALDDYYSARFDNERGYQYAYLFPAMNKVMQAAGRCIRGEKDRGVVAILDNRLLTSSYSRHVPPGLTFRPSRDVAADVRTFFYGGVHGQKCDSQARGGGGAETIEMARAGGRGEEQGAQGVSEPSA